VSPALSVGGRRVGARLAWLGGRVVLETADGRRVEYAARPLGGGEWILEGPEGAQRVVIARRGASTWVHCAGRTLVFEEESFAARQAHAAAGDGRLSAPMPATVLEVLAAQGDQVAEGQTLVVISAMKMQVDVKTPAAGVVRRLPVAAGDAGEAGALLAEVEAFPGEDA
jgi:biotin carboxyl carrier protein